MNPLEYQIELQRQVTEKRMCYILSRIRYLKVQIRKRVDLLEPTSYDDATAQLSILKEIYGLELELGLHSEELQFDVIGVRDE